MQSPRSRVFDLASAEVGTANVGKDDMTQSAAVAKARVWQVAARAGLGLVIAVVVAACGDDGERATTVTTTTSPSTTSTGEPQAPLPRPGRWVGITDDGRLVAVNAESGEQAKVLGEFDHPDECPRAGEPAAGCQWVAEVAMSPDGQSVYYETCCEPAPGAIHRVPIDGGEPEMVAFGAHPAVDPAGQRLAAVELQWVTVHELGGDDVLRFRDDDSPATLHGMTWSPDGAQLAFVAFDRTDEPGRLLVLDVHEADNLADARSIDRGDGGRSWTLPTFRRDGALVVVEQELELPDSPQGPARAVVVDPDSGEVRESFDRSGAVLSQDHDPSGTYLLYVLEDGSVRWEFDGTDGGVLAAGGYLAATW